MITSANPKNAGHRVFCYGSNLFSPRLRARVPGAALLSVGCVRGRRLRFHKRSVDGSAKADAHFTGHGADCVWGAVFAIPGDQKPQLDACEFLGVGYDEVAVELLGVSGADARCSLYQARLEAIDRRGRPYDWYLELVLAGAREHGLPAEYIDWLTRIDCVVDDDWQRRERHLRLLGAAA